MSLVTLNRHQPHGSDIGDPTPTAPTPSGHTSTFAALRIRNYRLFFAGQVVSNTGTWMQRIAQDWLVLQITNSPLAVGITTALQFLPMLLFGLWGGLIADRYPKRRLLLITQTVMGALAVAAGRPDPHRRGAGLAGLPDRARTRPGHRGRQPGPADLRQRDGAEGPGAQRGRR